MRRTVIVSSVREFAGGMVFDPTPAGLTPTYLLSNITHFPDRIHHAATLKVLGVGSTRLHGARFWSAGLVLSRMLLESHAGFSALSPTCVLIRQRTSWVSALIIFFLFCMA
jgi:hypothetical protein